jgi:hypothetical protein
MRRTGLNPIHVSQILGLLPRICWRKRDQTNLKGVNVAGSLRRKVVAVLALAVGFGVVTGTDSASAASSAGKHLAPASAKAPTVQTAADWWW